MVRHVVRPSNIMTTPRLLMETLGAKRTRKYPEDRPRFKPYDFNDDFFLIYPPGNLVTTDDGETYRSLYQFFSSTKPIQRGLLEQFGVRTIPFITRKADAELLRGKKFVEEDTYIVRPMRHSGGKDYRITNDPSDFKEGQEYISVLFPKKREYRVVFCKGVPIITLRKRVPEGIDHTQPWNHANGSVFVTVEHEENNHLLKTTVMNDLANCKIVQKSHLIGVDILLDKRSQNYAVLEINTCPAITLDHNLEKVKQIVHTV